MSLAIFQSHEKYFFLLTSGGYVCPHVYPEIFDKCTRQE